MHARALRPRATASSIRRSTFIFVLLCGDILCGLQAGVRTERVGKRLILDARRGKLPLRTLLEAPGIEPVLTQHIGNAAANG